MSVGCLRNLASDPLLIMAAAAHVSHRIDGGSRIGYAQVTVKLQTHRVRAVTYNDVELAARIQEVVLWTPSEKSALDGFPKRWVH